MTGGSGTGPRAEGRVATGGSAPARLPPVLFVVSAVSFAASPFVGWAAAGALAEHFYHARVLALVHGLALGWVSSAMIGVLYRYVPSVSKRPLPYPRAAVLQATVFVAGTLGLVSGFWSGNWAWAAAGTAALFVSALLLAANIVPPLLAAPRKGVAEVGILAGVVSLAAAAGLGMGFALDKLYPWAGGSLVSNLAAHAHLAAAGWVGAILCALSFRFLAAFLLPAKLPFEEARRIVVAIAALVFVLAVSLLSRNRLASLAGIALAAAFGAYGVLFARMVSSRRLPLDWTARHALAATVWLAAAIGVGAFLAGHGPQDEAGSRLALAYGFVGFLGWVGNFLVGVSYKLFPGFVAGARAERGLARISVADLGFPERTKPPVFAAYNAAVLVLAGSSLAGSAAGLRAGFAVLAFAAAVYSRFALRTLAAGFFGSSPSTPIADRAGPEG